MEVKVRLYLMAALPIARFSSTSLPACGLPPHCSRFVTNPAGDVLS